MWFEIIPSFGIIVGVLTVPGVAMYYMHKFTNGNPYKRDLLSSFDQFMYMRDRRLTGDPYKGNGLASVPDN